MPLSDRTESSPNQVLQSAGGLFLHSPFAILRFRLRRVSQSRFSGGQRRSYPSSDNLTEPGGGELEERRYFSMNKERSKREFVLLPPRPGSLPTTPSSLAFILGRLIA